MRQTRRIQDSLFWIILAIFLVFFLFIFVWMFVSSFKPNLLIVSDPPVWFFTPTLAHYIEVFERNPFATYLFNSLTIAVSSVALSLIVGLPAAYSIAKYKQDGLALALLVVRMLPGITFLVPLFIVYKRLGLLDSHAGIVITHILTVLPLIMWVMIGFFEDVPSELLDAALIDGCSQLGTMVRIMIPLSLPGITAVSILSFISSWNNFIFVL